MKIHNKYGTEEVEFTIFPSGECIPKIKHAVLPEQYIVEQSIASADDLMNVMNVTDALRMAGAKSVWLRAPYIMGGRQDRVCNPGEPLTARVVAGIINSAKFDTVSTNTPHSDVLPALINNCKVEYDDVNSIAFIMQQSEFKQVVLVAPDAGASKRVFEMANKLKRKGHYVTFAQGMKHRDVATGNISGFSCEEKFNKDQLLILVDDICANGGTFIGLANVLKEKGAENMALYVTHADSITIERAEEICQRLKDKGFATTNVVLGIGSFTYQGAVSLDCIVTRDTHGMAIKATYGEVKGEPREIFKDPITDDGLKKSAKGLIAVVKEDGEYKAIDQRCWEAVRSSEMKCIWKNGKFLQRTSLEDIRCKLTTG